MNILVLSDSHGQMPSVFLSKDRLFAKDGPLAGAARLDCIFHLGDCVRDAGPLSAIAPVVSVHGNCDPQGPTERLMDLEGVRVLLTHGHTLRVKLNLLSLSLYAREAGARIALFGHTHTAYQSESRGVTLFNPGSVSEPRVGGPSCGLLRLTHGTAALEHIKL